VVVIAVIDEPYPGIGDDWQIASRMRDQRKTGGVGKFLAATDQRYFGEQAFADARVQNDFAETRGAGGAGKEGAGQEGNTGQRGADQGRS